MQTRNVFIVLSLFLVLMSCSKDDDTGNSNSSSSTFTGKYNVYSYEDWFYTVDGGDSMLTIYGYGNEFNNASYTFENDVLYTAGNIVADWSYYLFGYEFSTVTDTIHMSNPSPSGYNIDEAAGTIQIGESTYILANFENQELIITFEDDQIDNNGDGTYYRQEWKLMK